MSWNVKHLDLWDEIAAEDVDVALLQEVPYPPGHPEGLHPQCDRCPREIVPSLESVWGTGGWEQRPWRTALARVSEAVSLQPIATGDMADIDWERLFVSRPGTIAAADVVADDKVLFTAVSVYAPWERPLGRDEPCWADSSAHRLLADLAPLLWNQRRHPVIVAGDWNILFGYGEKGSHYWKRRHQAVFAHAESLELRFVGPQYPNGRQADPWPEELPKDSLCVPTFHHSGQRPETATRQLDFVLASESIADRVRTKALNDVAAWGPSDHCRVAIEVDV